MQKQKLKLYLRHDRYRTADFRDRIQTTAIPGQHHERPPGACGKRAPAAAPQIPLRARLLHRRPGHLPQLQPKI